MLCICVFLFSGKKKKKTKHNRSREGSAIQVLSPPGPTIHTWLSRDCFIWSPGVPARIGGRGKRSACSEEGRKSQCCTDLHLTKGGQMSPFPAPLPVASGLGHLFSGATQQLCRDRVAFGGSCFNFLSPYGISILASVQSAGHRVHDDDSLKIFSLPNHNLVSLDFASGNCWEEALQPPVWNRGQ